ncbi:unnamed protein product [Pseudo-nitzschia multistriata]|uniref:Uncharacterized protein n=1 Tax=Pseudo-nitzschia multistriata TaxID=183589 RepID=A0A448YVN8_9STRA|nr:unnamed protein product [Pseudo-nitzschia multistriata]
MFRYSLASVLLSPQIIWTFIVDRSAAHRIAASASESGKVFVMYFSARSGWRVALPFSLAPLPWFGIARSSRARSIGPHRDPTTRSSSMTNGAALKPSVPAAQVLFSTRVPIGRHMPAASFRPAGDPVASTTTSYRFDAGCFPDQIQFVRMLSEQHGLGVGRAVDVVTVPTRFLVAATESRRVFPSQYLGNHQSEFPITKNSHLVGGNPSRFVFIPHQVLFDDPAGGCQRLGKDSHLVRNVVRDFVQIAEGQCQVFCHGSVLVQNPEHRPVRAVVPAHLGTAPGKIPIVGSIGANPAGSATNVDVSTDSLSHPPLSQFLALGIHLRDDPHKFVAKNPRESHVALEDFQIGVADPCSQDPDQSFVGEGLRNRKVILE